MNSCTRLLGIGIIFLDSDQHLHPQTSVVYPDPGEIIPDPDSSGSEMKRNFYGKTDKI